MADTTQEDTDGQYLALLVPALIAFIAGLLIHSFIIGINVTDWWKGRSVTPVDHIVTYLGMSRMCAQILKTLFFCLTTFLQNKMDLEVTLTIMEIAYDFFSYANIWFTSLLSIVFCLKISNLHTRLFLYLRRMIVHRTGYFIAASVLFSIFSSLIPIPIYITESTGDGTYNTTLDKKFSDCITINFIYIFTIGPFTPLLFNFISSVLLFTSLYHHITKMKMSSNLSINLETYYSAMRFVCFTFIYNTLYPIVNLVCVFYYYLYCADLDWLRIFMDFLPVLHSSYLIYRTAKLRSQMSKVLQNVIDFLFQRTFTTENIEVVSQ